MRLSNNLPRSLRGDRETDQEHLHTGLSKGIDLLCCFNFRKLSRPVVSGPLVSDVLKPINPGAWFRLQKERRPPRVSACEADNGCNAHVEIGVGLSLITQRRETIDEPGRDVLPLYGHSSCVCGNAHRRSRTGSNDLAAAYNDDCVLNIRAGLAEA